MKDMEIIDDFINFLKTKSLGHQEICQYLVTVSLKEYKFFGALFTEVQKNGTVKIVSSFGVDKKDVDEWQDIPIDAKTPVNDCLIENKIVWVNPVDNEYIDYQILNELPRDNRVQTLVAVPVRGSSNVIGSLALLSYDKILIDKSMELLITTLSNLSVFSLEVNERYSAAKLPLESAKGEINKDLFTRLTERQKIIFSLLNKKKTNKEIADFLGYSVSTIKQETISIYEVLEIRGREDIYLFNDKTA